MEFVTKFVNGFVHHEGVEQDCELVVVLGYKGRVTGGFQIAFQECPRGPVPPEVRPWLHAGKVEVARRAGSQLLDGRGKRCVVERTQHPGDVSQCGALETPLAQRTRRLALAIDDGEVPASDKTRPGV